MRVLVVTPDYPPPPGGIQTVVQNLEEGLKNLGHTPIIVQIDPQAYSSTLADAIPTQRTLDAVKMRSPHFYRYFNTVYRRTSDAIEEHNPDVVHAAHIRVWPALQAATDHGLSTVVTAHALELENRRLASVAFEEATAVHAVSEFTGSVIERDHGIFPDEIIHPSIDIDSYAPSDGELADGVNNVFTISRLVGRKNIDTIVDAWEQLGPESRGERTLDIAGTGPEYDTLVAKTEDMDSVRMLGRISESEKITRLQNADLFVLPAGGTNYDVEGFGIVYIEAQAAGTPVIGSSIGGAPEAIGDGGLLLNDERDPDELAVKIAAFLSNREKIEQYTTQAQRRVEAFDLNPIAAQYVDLYQHIL
ncbi:MULTISPECIES: glycosyltransferase family 4 protein [unclassified Natrinema]|uniref:glycosyltransferase family 4 protein n=1 Tax=unclassified Natrinema TaxID=2622230 RepID=UPI00026D46AF|nr:MULTISPECIES: glycosyltransferase family 4 protein [unclassified Natrinema]AFO59063.1 group 1 glycosyl transferase [Natrinema sp. J7-2]